MKRWLGNLLQMNLYSVVVGSAILVGLTLLVSGTGKLPETAEFTAAKT